MQSQYNTMVGGARMIYDYPHPAPEWSGIFEAGVCARESLPMKRDAGSGRPLLIAAMELLTDAPAQTIMQGWEPGAILLVCLRWRVSEPPIASFATNAFQQDR
jgi:hypothetical protein